MKDLKQTVYKHSPGALTLINRLVFGTGHLLSEGGRWLSNEGRPQFMPIRDGLNSKITFYGATWKILLPSRQNIGHLYYYYCYMQPKNRVCNINYLHVFLLCELWLYVQQRLNSSNVRHLQ